jgi:uncharacterized protein GlcG (DUF336 family)
VEKPLVERSRGHSAVLSLEVASAACSGAIRRATELGLSINVAVTDASGVLTAFQRMPGSSQPAVEYAIDKAYSATMTGVPSNQWVDMLVHDRMHDIGLPLRPRLTVFGGGLPLMDGRTLVGGIGVSGGTAAQDEDCARAGARQAGLFGR